MTKRTPDPEPAVPGLTLGEKIAAGVAAAGAVAGVIAATVVITKRRNALPPDPLAALRASGINIPTKPAGPDNTGRDVATGVAVAGDVVKVAGTIADLAG